MEYMVEGSRSKDMSGSRKGSVRTSSVILGSKFAGYTLLLIGFIGLIWPFFLLSNFTQYPGCVASDLFPYSNGYPSDRIVSFILFVQLPIALLASLLIGLGASLIRTSGVVVGNVLTVASIALGATATIFLLVRVAGFSVAPVDCGSYTNVLPDLNLIINSRSR